MLYGNSLDTLFVVKDCRSKRVSSYAKDGSNHDWWTIEKGETREIMDINACGIIRHIWCTMGCDDEWFPRKVVIRMYWDGEEMPSVEAPIGDFFGIGHGIIKNFISEPLTMSPQDGRAFNCFFPMPFSSRALITITNECNAPVNFYFYIDYEVYDRIEDNFGRFHAQWGREKDTNGWAERNTRVFDDKAGPPEPGWYPKVWTTANVTGMDNYIILEAEGKGHYVGCNLNVDCFERQANDWYGEGDDMIFIDGEPWPPSLHGTGTEDYFNTAFCPRQEFNAPYHGLTVYSGDDAGWPWGGKNSLYRFHIKDPVHFSKSIKVTIEHGHNNLLSNDYSSTAYWYQLEPHKPFPALLPVEDRLPRKR